MGGGGGDAVAGVLGERGWLGLRVVPWVGSLVGWKPARRVGPRAATCPSRDASRAGPGVRESSETWTPLGPVTCGLGDGGLHGQPEPCPVVDTTRVPAGCLSVGTRDRVLCGVLDTWSGNILSLRERVPRRSLSLSLSVFQNRVRAPCKGHWVPRCDLSVNTIVPSHLIRQEEVSGNSREIKDDWIG